MDVEYLGLHTKYHSVVTSHYRPCDRQYSKTICFTFVKLKWLQLSHFASKSINSTLQIFAHILHNCLIKLSMWECFYYNFVMRHPVEEGKIL